MLILFAQWLRSTMAEMLLRSLRGTCVETVPHRVPFCIRWFIREASPGQGWNAFTSNAGSRRLQNLQIDRWILLVPLLLRPTKTCLLCARKRVRVNVYVLEQSTLYRFYVRPLLFFPPRNNNTFTRDNTAISGKFNTTPK